MDTGGKATLSSDSTAEAERSTKSQRHEEKERAVTKPIFVGYSLDDAKWLYELRQSLRRLEELGLIGFWSVTKELRPFAERLGEIRMALKSADVMVFLVSQDFLDSAFIRDKEVPALIDAAINRGCLIFWIPLASSTSGLDMLEGAIPPNTLAMLQATISPTPLDLLSEPEQKKILAEISQKITAAVLAIR
jgi:hypothetical protein